MNNFYTITGFVRTREVIIRKNYSNEVKYLDPKISQAIVNHSPDGFTWGYGGSGPAQLAASIMLELTGSISGYQTLKWNIIAKLNKNKDFEFETNDKQIMEIVKENPTLKRRNE